MSVDENRPPDAQERFAALGRVMGELVHDLNNQVMVLQGWAMLARGELEAGRLPAPEVERVVGISERMALMLRDMLDATAGRGLSPEVVFDPQDLTEETIADRVHGMSSASLRFESSLPPSVQVRGRASFWIRTLANLLDNATRHARGRILVSLSLATTRAQGEVVVLRVEDDGAGIAPVDREHIFHPFWRGASGEIGLGLSSVEWAVSQLGGTIAYRDDSTLGGAAFEVLVPVARRLADPPEPASDSLDHVLRGTRVLVMDDDPTVRRATHLLLKRAGVEVREMDPSGEPEAHVLQSIMSVLPDVVLLDLRLGDRGGLALWKRMCLEMPQLAERVIFVTGAGPGEPDWEQAQSSGQPLLGKPFGLTELVRTVQRLRTEP
jgi:CheY-like chemotaxis protein